MSFPVPCIVCGAYLARLHESERIERQHRGLYTPVASVASVASEPLTVSERNTSSVSNTPGRGQNQAFLRCDACSATWSPPQDVRDAIRGTPEHLTVAGAASPLQPGEREVTPEDLDRLVDSRPVPF
jgi:hypothetical protein